MAAIERHYSLKEIAGLWGLSTDTIRRIFRNRPGVLKLNSPETRSKRGYLVLRIPESILQKAHAERCGRAA